MATPCLKRQPATAYHVEANCWLDLGHAGPCKFVVDNRCVFILKHGVQCHEPTFIGDRELCRTHRSSEFEERFRDQSRRREFLKESFVKPVPVGVHDPDFHLPTMEEGQRFLDSILREICAGSSMMNRSYLTAAQRETFTEHLQLALMRRADCKVLPPFRVELTSMQESDGTFSLSIANYTGVLLLAQKGRANTTQPPSKPLVRHTLKEILNRRSGPWKF